MQVEYLTEETLSTYLNQIFPGVEFIHNKAFPGYKFRPDYRSEELKLIIEFDGYQHYTSAKNIIKDQEKDRIYTEAGYKVVRIPYFIQLETRTIEHLFGKSIIIKQTYSHGFIADNSTLILPADFCELGIAKFKNDLVRFKYIEDEILNSLITKIHKLGNQDLVIPRSISYVIEFYLAKIKPNRYQLETLDIVLESSTFIGSLAQDK